MKSITVASFVLAVLFPVVVVAQSPAAVLGPGPAALPVNVYAAGLSYSTNATPELAGSALYARLVDAKLGTYGFTEFDALPTSAKPLSVQTDVAVGVAQKAFSIGKVAIYVPADAGVAWKGKNMGWSWSTGALASIKIYDNWRIYPNVRFRGSSVSDGSGIQPIFGILIGYAK